MSKYVNLMVKLLSAALPATQTMKLRLTSFTFDQQKTLEMMFSLMWILPLLILFLANLKNIPGVYHLRLLNAFRFVLRTQRNTDGPKPEQLFQPIITSSKATLMETDLNMHKSNSTYFSDIDVARTHLICTLFSKGIEKVRGGTTGIINGKPSPFAVALGAVSCSFRRELKPYEPYEMWTRVLAWDEKWLYIVTHFLRKDANIKPNEMTLHKCQNGVYGSTGTVRRNSSRRSTVTLNESFRQTSATSGCLEDSRSAITASALSKVVFKNGRITISPERMLEASGLLPRRPIGSGAAQSDGLTNIVQVAEIQVAPVKVMQTIDDLKSSSQESSQRWQRSSLDESTLDQRRWDMIECERVRGLTVASALAAQSNLENELTHTEALGRHTDGCGITGVVFTLAQLGKLSSYQFL